MKHIAFLKLAVLAVTALVLVSILGVSWVRAQPPPAAAGHAAAAP